MLKVLIVDDEPTVRRGIALGVDWQRLGCLVAGEAGNGLEGYEKALALSPQLIITDIRMPQLDGIEMLRRLRQAGCGAHVILLTAYSDFAYARSALQLGAEDYLLKPFRDQELENAVIKIAAQIRKRRAPQGEGLMPSPPGEVSRYTRLCMDYIARHYGDGEISITAIADALAISESHLSHVFKKETGVTITHYLTRYRIHTAMRLLRETPLKVYEVAQRVGYRDVTYFGATFKKLTGMNPSEYVEG